MNQVRMFIFAFAINIIGIIYKFLRILLSVLTKDHTKPYHLSGSLRRIRS